MRNPFKFTAVKPGVQELYSKLEKTYTTSIESFKPEDIHILLFFYLSLGNWIENKIALDTPVEITRVLKQTKNVLAYKDDKHQRILTHTHVLENPFSIPTNLYAFAIAAGVSVAKFKELFNVEVGDTIVEDYLKNENTVQVINNKINILSEFTRHIKIDPTIPKVLIQDKEEMEHIIFTGILKKQKAIAPFELILEEEEIEDDS